MVSTTCSTKCLRSLPSWNNSISRYVVEKQFLRMTAENSYPDETTFTLVLKACRGDNSLAFDFVKAIHAKIVCHGFSSSSLVSNSLMDVYSKNGFVDSAQKVFARLCMRDSVSWLAMISGLSQNGHEAKAALLFCKMHTSGTVPTPYIFSSVLSACAKVRFFKLGWQIHGLVSKFGFSSHTFVCNSLVTFYCHEGSWVSAEEIFLEMPCRDGASYNSLLSGLAQCGFTDRALGLFRRMQNDCLDPNFVTAATLLNICGSIGDTTKGKQLHLYALKSGIVSETVVEGSLLDLYVKCGDMEAASEVFQTTNRQNIVLWNIMLVGYGQLEDLTASVDMFKKLNTEGVMPNQYTYSSILKACTSVGTLNLGEQIHCRVIKSGFHHNLYVNSVLIDMYAKNRELESARGILSRIGKDDVVAWTSLIAGFVQHGLFDEALDLFREMQTQGIDPDNIGLASAISACAGKRALYQGQQLHAKSLICGYSLDLSIGNALISLYSGCGRAQEAYSAFDNVESQNSISWNGLISGFAHCGYHQEALEVFVRMQKFGMCPNLYTFCSAASAAANTANTIVGKQIHSSVVKRGYGSKPEVSNVLISLYAKCGIIDDAEVLFNEMVEKNEVSWNAMITGYSQHGLGDKALDLFNLMRRFSVEPNHVTFLGAITACSHVGLVDRGLEYFRSMTGFGLLPKPEHYASVVDLLGRSGHLGRAKKFIEEMPIEPDAMVWRTLLSACAVHKNVEIGEFAGRCLHELEPEDSATYVLRSNLYAVTGRWKHRDQTRKLMKDKGVRKEPGRSWIEVKSSVHEFFAGDRRHPLADEIYERVSHLDFRASEIGYVREIFSLRSVEENGTASVHSEKLAIAFGLLSLVDSTPIRVIKNIRICNDCHSWVKFVSKVSDRKIIVRDAYRFHHFDGGVCSCRDHW